jgi:hypothetical protein
MLCYNTHACWLKAKLNEIFRSQTQKKIVHKSAKSLYFPRTLTVKTFRHQRQLFTFGTVEYKSYFQFIN